MLLTTRQAAERLGVTWSYVRHLIRSGRLRAEPIGGRNYLISEKSLAAYRPRTRGADKKPRKRREKG